MRGHMDTSVDGVDFGIDYTLRGEAAKMEPSVVYIHGLACSESDFAEARELGLGPREVLSFTHPGCDNTPYPDAPLGIDHLVEATHDLIVAARLPNVILVGHSIGGIVAVRYAERYPSRVTGVVSVEGNMRDSDCFMTRKITNGEETRESLITRFAMSSNPGFGRFVKRLLRTDPRALRDYAASAVAESDHGDLFDSFVNLSVPQLFVCGERNVGAIGYVDELKAKGVEIAVITGSDHFPDADNPREYYRAIGDFVRRVTASVLG